MSSAQLTAAPSPAVTVPAAKSAVSRKQIAIAAGLIVALAAAV